MHPIILALGQINLYSFSVFLILAWIIFSFLFWKLLRLANIEEEKIFDLTFYSTLAAIVGARFGFVITHLPLFRDSILKVFAFWVQPGLSLYSAWIFGIATIIYLCRQYKLRLGIVLDTLAIVLPSSLFLGLIGSFLDGTVVGKIANLPFSVRYLGQVGRRHPVQIYEMLVMAVLIYLSVYLYRKSEKAKWTYGLVGIYFFLIYTSVMFVVEFFKDSSVYWLNLSANQWIMIAIFAEAFGAFLVRGGGREKIRPYINRIRLSISNFGGSIYAKFSHRRTGTN